MIDLHVHIDKDDGKLSEDKVIDLAVQQGVTALGVSMHDCVDYQEEIASKCRENGMDPFAMTELTARDGHYLMFLPDFRAADDGEFKKRLKSIYDARERRIRELARKTQEMPIGLDIPGLGIFDFRIDAEKLESLVNYGRYMTGHLAQLLVIETGGAIKRDPAYRLLDRCLNTHEYNGAHYYMDSLFTLDEIVDYKKRFDGIVIEAHPRVIDRAKLKCGLDGFEVSSKNGVTMNLSLIKMSEEYGFLISAGSDNHFWDTDKLGLISRQPELKGVLDESRVISSINGRLEKKY